MKAFNQGVDLCIKHLKETAISTNALKPLNHIKDVTPNHPSSCSDINPDKQHTPSQGQGNEVGNEFIEIELMSSGVLIPENQMFSKYHVGKQSDTLSQWHCAGAETPAAVVDDDNDVGWFFEDGVDPGPPQLDSDAATLLECMTDNDFGISKPIPCDNLLMKGMCTAHIKSSEQGSWPSISTKHEDVDSEFDSCFDDIISSNTDYCKTDTDAKSGKEQMIKFDVSNRDDNDSEFDSCFDDISNSEKATAKVNESTNTSLFSEIPDVLPSCYHETECGIISQSSSESELTNTVATMDIHEKLEQQLRLKPSNTATTTLSRSRHFKNYSVDY